MFSCLLFLMLLSLGLTRAWGFGPGSTAFVHLGRRRSSRILQKRPPFTTTTAAILQKPIIRCKQQTTTSPFVRAASSSSTSTTRRFLGATTTTTWKIGDTVLVDLNKDQSELKPGVIEEIRKAGWYSIRLLDEKNYDDDTTAQKLPGLIHKVRKSQLHANNAAAAGSEEEAEAAQQNSAPTEMAPHLPDLSNIPYDALPIQELVQAMPGLTTEVDIPNRYPIDPNAPPPPPKMDNLDALLKDMQIDGDANFAHYNATQQEYLQQLQHFATNIRYWVVFTDLHCAPSTLDTCLQVLQKVHQIAKARDSNDRQRQTGVIFLGDFWHHRGTLRVDCLNAILQELRHWTVPMILIPGNHDQVTLGGHSHGLTPLENSYRVSIGDGDNNQSLSLSVPGPLVFSHPTLFAGALFVPHIRHIGVLESILQSEMATSSDASKAIMVHADVTGAYMNDMIVSTGGIHPSVFPPNKRIYSGHFHKPHIVTHKSSGVLIEYLGSPYETSLAEAQQSKSLVILDAKQQWKCIERIPLSIGRKHYKPHSITELLALRLTPRSAGDDDNKHQTLIREGDRIVATLSRRELMGLDDEVEDHIRQLRKSGVAVEVREDTDSNNNTTGAADLNNKTTTTTDLDDLSPTSTWERFWEEQIQRGVFETDVATDLNKAGMALLEEIDEDVQQQQQQQQSSSGGTTTDSSSLLMATTTNLQFETVIVEGYGPFPNRVEYPLNDRGLVLLRGTNLDGGSDSNGSGKTSLAMATLWALTGQTDPRPLQDSKVADVVNDSNRNARVTVTGKVNGKSFSITRTKTPRKSGLAFILDGHDLTTQSVKETMLVVEEKLGVSAPILARTMFHGQHALDGLLEATDAKLKEELSLVVPLELWQAAATLARSKGKKASKKQSELEGMASLRMDDLQKFKERCLQAAADLSEKERALEAKQAELEQYNTQQSVKMGGQLIDESAIEILRGSIEEATSQLDAAQNQIRSIAEERESVLQVISKQLSKQMMLAKESADCHQQIQLDYQSSTYQMATLESRVASLESRWQVDLSSGHLPVDFEVPDTCPTCLQPLPQQNGAATHDHHNVQAKAEEEIKQTLESLASAEKSLALWREQLDSAKLLQEDNNAKVVAIQEELKDKAEYWDERLSHSEKELAQYQKQVAELTKDFAAKAEFNQQAALAESRLESQVRAAHEAVRFAREAHDSLKAELESMAVEIGQLRAQIKEQNGFSKQMSSLSDAFGIRGVQTFVLQNAVKELQSLTQKYLDDFSEGTQRLELSLDAAAGDNKISRQALVREPDGSYRERPLATLSGGQWRRCSLALTLGFADLVATRGGLRPNLIILDEPLTHLDRAGRSDVGKVLRKMLGQQSHSSANTSHGYSNFSVSTIIIILQDLAAEELEEDFDRIDEVVKQNGESSVKVDESS